MPDSSHFNEDVSSYWILLRSYRLLFMDPFKSSVHLSATRRHFLLPFLTSSLFLELPFCNQSHKPIFWHPLLRRTSHLMAFLLGAPEDRHGVSLPRALDRLPQRSYSQTQELHPCSAHALCTDAVFLRHKFRHRKTLRTFSSIAFSKSPISSTVKCPL